MLLSPRGEQYARKLPDLVRESVGVSFNPNHSSYEILKMYLESTDFRLALTMVI